MTPARQRSRQSRLLPLSREGFLWFFTALAMLLTGLFRSINLITLLACWIIALVLLNFAWARRQLRQVRGSRSFPEPAFAEAPVSYQVNLDNPGGAACHGISVRDGGEIHEFTLFAPALAARSTSSFTVTLVPQRRGRYRFDPLSIASGHPLGLAHVGRELEGEGAELIVFPRLEHVHQGRIRAFLSRQSPSLGQARAFPRRHPGAQSEFHGLRSFRGGDSPRWIHWRTTARRGELMVREFEDTPDDDLVLIVEPGMQAGAAALERLLSLAASLCWQSCRQTGDRMLFAVAGVAPVVLQGRTGHEFALQALHALAVVDGGAAYDAALLPRALEAAALPRGPVLLLTTQESGLADALGGLLRRPIAEIHVERGEEELFLEKKAAVTHAAGAD